MQLQLILEKDITPMQQETVKMLQKECFGDVPQESVEEDFIAESFAKIFAYEGDTLIGMLSLKKREITFSGRKIFVGGVGGVCITKSMRGRGIATQMLEKAIEVLRKEKCDIACLNVDTTKQAYKLYEKLGFVMMKRPVSFITSKGKLKYDTGTMFRSIHSKEIYDLVMNSNETFHYGTGYW